ncbi:ABC transporter substrate-binding protein [Scytonema sp. PCC 10023]|uniref:ABC transporter substrate-binding protein n=1 Tax=Scytonema sp. PCC 10023 TaxID=1680591 RepID=UPI0039C6C335
MKKFLRRLTYTLFMGIVAFVLASGCHPSSYQNATNQITPAKDCRVVQHTIGETCIPKNPKRLVTISHFTLANALVLGVKPIGTTSVTNNMQDKFPEYLKSKIKGIEVLGTQNEPNIERILRLKPDLILGWEKVQPIYPLLSQISPTALGKWYGPASWQKHFDFVIEVLGKQEEARQAWNHYYQRIDELKTALNNRYQDKKISVVIPSSEWGFFIQTKNSFAGFILNDLGLQRPQLQDVNTSDGYIIFNSKEKLEMIDGDIIFVLTHKDDERKAFEEILQSPLGRRLKAVQQGRVYSVDGLTWIASNLLAADAVIDDLFKYLVNTP